MHSFLENPYSPTHVPQGAVWGEKGAVWVVCLMDGGVFKCFVLLLFDAIMLLCSVGEGLNPPFCGSIQLYTSHLSFDRFARYYNIPLMLKFTL